MLLIRIVDIVNKVRVVLKNLCNIRIGLFRKLRNCKDKSALNKFDKH